MTAGIERVDHYRASEKYVTIERWSSYWHQLDAIIRTGAGTVLEVGVGPKMLSGYLREFAGLEVTTIDVNEELKPDVLCDLRSLADHFPERSFDCVCAFQVLEHIPYEDFGLCLKQMARVSREHVLISLPYWGYRFQFRLGIHRFNLAYGRKITRPFEWRGNHPHSWEIGVSGYPLKKIKTEMEKHFEIKRSRFCPDNPYHYFFECVTRKRADHG